MRPSVILLLLAMIVAHAPLLSARDKEPRPGDPVANFAFTDFAGQEHHLADFAGRYVLLDFWATWCQPCVKEIPDLIKAREQFGARGLVIIGMNSDKKLEKARKFVEEKGVTWLQSSDESTKEVIHHVLKVEWYPTLILIGPDGRSLAGSSGEKPPLYGPTLLKTLDQTLPPAHP